MMRRLAQRINPGVRRLRDPTRCARTAPRRGGRFFLALLFVLTPVIEAPAQDEAGHRMIWDVNGMVMGENRGDELPVGCESISEDVAITVIVGRDYAREGFVFGYSEYEWKVKPCARLSVTLINEDRVRHMWMLHGLPRYLYYLGMFHLEVEGGRRMTGTFIVPSSDATYFVHCDVAQHTEKGLKAQLIAGKGSGDLPGIPGITPPLFAGSSGK